MPGILVLEDRPELLQIMVELLERLDQVVWPCPGLDEAERVLRQEEDLWLAVYDVEIRTGQQVLQSFGQMELHLQLRPQVPFAVKTGNPEVILPQTIDEAKLARLTDRLSKAVLAEVIEMAKRHWEAK